MMAALLVDAEKFPGTVRVFRLMAAPACRVKLVLAGSVNACDMLNAPLFREPMTIERPTIRLISCALRPNVGGLEEGASLPPILIKAPALFGEMVIVPAP